MMDDPAFDEAATLDLVPPERPTGLYAHPEVYAALRAPDPDTLAAVFDLLARHVLDGRTASEAPSLLDPACGPGNWLLPFARSGWRVAGNDLAPEMVAGARRALAAAGTEFEVVEGDMRALALASGPFDAALEIAGTSGLLAHERDLAAHLATVADHLKPGGVFLLTVFLDVRASAGDVAYPRLCHASEPLEVADAEGRPLLVRARYELDGWSERPATAQMRRTVEVAPAAGGEPHVLVDRYGLRSWREADLVALVARQGRYDLVDLDAIGPPTPAGDPLAEQTLVLRRR